MDKEIQKKVESFGATLYDTELESVDESHIFRVLFAFPSRYLFTIGR